MRVDFKDDKLRELYTTGRGPVARRVGKGVILRFFEVMADIAAADSEQDLRALKGLHFEKLTGNLEGHFSVRLNRQFRLVFQIQADAEGKLLFIEAIADYH